MANIVLGAAMEGYVDIYGEYNWNLSVNSSSATSVTLEDDNGNKVIFNGTGLVFNGTVPTGGTVTSVIFESAGGDPFVTVTGTFAAADLAADKPDDLFSILSAGDDTISSTTPDVVFNFGSNTGNDVISVLAPGSFVLASAGDDTINGGDFGNWDALSYESAYWEDGAFKGVKVNANTGIAKDAWGDIDTFNNIEEFRGTGFVDKFTGSASNEAFMGFGGDDIINGGGGSDEIRYHADEQQGGTGGIVANLAKGLVKDGFGDLDVVKNIEGVYGTYFNDKFIGDANDNYFRGLSGVDSFKGGAGTDVVQMFWFQDLGQTGVNVNLALTTGQIIDDGFGNTETTKSIESVEGSQFDDTLQLGVSDGWAWGDDGDDVLIAGRGSQWFGGGGGADTFRFLSAEDAAGDDIIDDFDGGEGDQIDLSAIAGLTFIDNAAFSGVAGQVRAFADNGHTYIEVDTDGDSEANFTLDLQNGASVTAGDLVL